jgi:hypothetical protein
MEIDRNIARRLLIPAACALAAACATPHERVVVQKVSVPVAVPCKVTLPDKPAYAADTVSLDGSIFDLVQALLIDRETRKAHEAELEAAAKSCS